MKSFSCMSRSRLFLQHSKRLTLYTLRRRAFLSQRKLHCQKTKRRGSYCDGAADILQPFLTLSLSLSAFILSFGGNGRVLKTENWKSREDSVPGGREGRQGKKNLSLVVQGADRNDQWRPCVVSKMWNFRRLAKNPAFFCFNCCCILISDNREATLWDFVVDKMYNQLPSSWN